VKVLARNVQTGIDDAAVAEYSRLIEDELNTDLDNRFSEWRDMYDSVKAGQSDISVIPSVIISVINYRVAALFEAAKYAQNTAGFAQRNPYSRQLEDIANRLWENITNGDASISGLTRFSAVASLPSDPGSFVPMGGLTSAADLASEIVDGY
jgi:hypothetical protein